MTGLGRCRQKEESIAVGPPTSVLPQGQGSTIRILSFIVIECVPMAEFKSKVIPSPQMDEYVFVRISL